MPEPLPPEPNRPLPLEYRRYEASVSKLRPLPMRAYVVAGAALLVFLVAFSVYSAYSRRKAQSMSRRALCCSNLIAIELSMDAYADSHQGKYPDKFEDLLLTSSISSQDFCCPGSNDTPATGTLQQQAAALSSGGHCSYIYLGKGLSKGCASDVVMVYEPLANHKGEGIFVLFGDYHIQWLGAADAQKLINSVGPGKLTRWSPPGGK